MLDLSSGARTAQTTLTIDDLAAATGTTTRRIRSLQTLGLLPHPTLRGRTGLYDGRHRSRLEAVLHLQDQGFSLESLGVLFDALQAGRSLADRPRRGRAATTRVGAGPRRRLGRALRLRRAAAGRPAPRRERPLLSVVPTTVWDESQASCRSGRPSAATLRSVASAGVPASPAHPAPALGRGGPASEPTSP